MQDCKGKCPLAYLCHALLLHIIFLLCNFCFHPLEFSVFGFLKKDNIFFFFHSFVLNNIYLISYKILKISSLPYSFPFSPAAVLGNTYILARETCCGFASVSFWNELCVSRSAWYTGVPGISCLCFTFVLSTREHTALSQFL
jgi:hypothetical protein